MGASCKPEEADKFKEDEIPEPLMVSKTAAKIQW